MSEVLVTVIIPVYNTAKWLPDCLDSVLRQTYGGLEVLCIDDCSTDPRCRRIIEEYAGRDARVVPVFLEKNRKQGHARNLGMDMARGKYLYFLDSDDMVREDAFAFLTELAEKEALEAVFFDSSVIYEDAGLEKLYNSYQPVRQGVYPQGTVSGISLFEDFVRQREWTAFVQRQFWSAAFLRESGVRFPENMAHEDEYFSLCAAITAKKVRYVRKAFFIRRFRKDSVMTKKVSATNVHGYLRNLIYLRRFAEKHGIRSEQFEKEMCRIYNRFCYCYDNTEDKDALDAWFREKDERDVFNFFLLSRKAGRYVRPLNAELAETARQKNIYIYGAGFLGQAALRSLVNAGLSVAGFLVTDSRGNPEAISGHRVRALRDVSFSPDDYVIVAVRPGFRAEIEDALRARGVAFTHDWEENK